LDSAPDILIAGIGNIFFGDDAFGCKVAERLCECQWPAGVRVADFGIRGIDLAYALTDGCEFAILIDAMPRGGSPGDLYVIEPTLDESDAPANAGGSLWDAHTMNPEKVLRLAESLGGEMARVVVVGCEPAIADEDADVHAGLTPAVDSVIGTAAELVQSILNDYLAERSANYASA
jgi:hydrogenase maturation protease